jgi:hypothetical protein
MCGCDFNTDLQPNAVSFREEELRENDCFLELEKLTFLRMIY